MAAILACPAPGQEDPAIASSSTQRHLTITPAGHRPQMDTLPGVDLNEPYEPTFSDDSRQDDSRQDDSRQDDSQQDNSRTSEFEDSYDPTNPKYPQGNPEALRLLARTEAGRKLIEEETAAAELSVREREEQLAKVTRELSQLTPPSVEPALRTPAQVDTDVDMTLEKPVQETGTTTGDSPKGPAGSPITPLLL